MACPGLFTDGEGKDVRKATCRDSHCWSAKANASVARELAQEREKHPEPVLVAAEERLNWPVGPTATAVVIVLFAAASGLGWILDRGSQGSANPR